jgi:hypothetical protein
MICFFQFQKKGIVL